MSVKINENPEHGISLDYIKAVNAVSKQNAARKGGISLEYIANITGSKNSAITGISSKGTGIVPDNETSSTPDPETAGDTTPKSSVKAPGKSKINDISADRRPVVYEVPETKINTVKPADTIANTDVKAAVPPSSDTTTKQYTKARVTAAPFMRTETVDNTIPTLLSVETATPPKTETAVEVSPDHRIGRLTVYDPDAEQIALAENAAELIERKKTSNSFDSIKWRVENDLFDVNQAVDWEADPNATAVSDSLKYLIEVEKKKLSGYENITNDMSVFGYQMNKLGKSYNEAYEQMIHTCYPDGNSPYTSAQDFREKCIQYAQSITQSGDNNEHAGKVDSHRAFIEELEMLYDYRLKSEEYQRLDYVAAPIERNAYTADNFYEIAQQGMICDDEYKDFSERRKELTYESMLFSSAISSLQAEDRTLKTLRSEVKEFEDSLSNPVAYIEAHRDKIQEESGLNAWTDGESLLLSGIYTPEYFYFTEAEALIYSYYAETEGRKKADEYMQSIMHRLTLRREQFLAENNGMEKVAAWAEKNDFLAGAASLLTNLPGGLLSFGGMVTGETNPYSPTFYLTHLTQALREGATRDDSKAGALAANAIMSAGDNVLTLAFGPLGLYIMSASATGTAYSDALQRGCPQDEAVAYAVVSGSIEFLTEKLPFDKLLSRVNSGAVFTQKEWAKEIAKILAEHGLPEFGEEAINSYASTLMEIQVLGDKSSYNQYIEYMMFEQGMSYEDAVKDANNYFFIVQPIESAVTGFASGSMLSAGVTGVNTAVNAVNNTQAESFKTGAELAQKIIDGEQLTVKEKKSILKKTPISQARKTLEAVTGVSLEGDFSTVSAKLDAMANEYARKKQESVDLTGAQTVDVQSDVGSQLEQTAELAPSAMSASSDTSLQSDIVTEPLAISAQTGQPTVQNISLENAHNIANVQKGNDYADKLENARMEQEEKYGSALVRNAGRAAEVLSKGTRASGSASTMHKGGVTLNIGNGQSITSISIDDIAGYSSKNRWGISRNVSSQVNAIEASANRTGLDVYFYDGSVTPIRGHDGERVNGFRHKGSDGEYIAIDITADAPLLFVFGHEMFHAMGKESEAKLTKYLSDYYGKQLTVEEAANVLGESLCDPAFCEYLVNKNRPLAQKVLGFIKNFIAKLKGQDVQELNTAHKTLANALSKYIENRNETTSEGLSFMYKGKSDDGIDIFETSKETQKMTWAERLQKFKDNFYNPNSPHYLGAKVAFERDGKIQYAEIDRFTQKENTGKINPRKLNQWDKAKINMGADGDFILLTENARYDRHSRNENKQKNDAHKRTEYFEYYVKSVRVDGKDYDVVVNIRAERSGNKFVYEVKLKQKKESSPQGPQIKNNRRPKVQSTRLSEESDISIPNSGEDVNSFMYAGTNAKNANASALETAKQMDSNGVDSETIRKETGWHKGYDGKWRFEIDDSRMDFKKSSDYVAAGFARLNELKSKVINAREDFTNKELKELLSLMKKLNGAKISHVTLENLLEHDALFNSYPELQNMPVSFTQFEDSRLGEYRGRDEGIALSEKLLGDENELKGTLVHEIQHAVQDVEGFANGTAPSYWESKLLKGARNERSERLKKAIDSLSKEERAEYDRYHELDNLIEEVIRNESYESDVSLQELCHRLISEMEEMGKRLKAEKWFQNIESIQFEYLDVSKEARELYRKTAGEGEAYDTQARRELNSEQRKNTRPDIDRKDVVFADEGIRAMSEDETKSIKQQLQIHSNIINDMEPVKTIDVEVQPGMNKKQRLQTILNDYRSHMGERIERQGFGTIIIEKQQIDDSLNYMNSEAEYAAFFTVPYVIKRGIVISGHNDHKGRSYSTVTVAAPVVINGVRGNVAVVIKRTGKNKYKTHRILLPNGSAFEFKNKNAEFTTGDIITVSDNEGTPINSASTTSIPDSDKDVNSFMSRSSHTDIGDGVSVKKVDAQVRAGRNKRFAAEHDLINRIARRTRTKVQYASSIMQNGKALSGGCYYHRASGTLYLNVNSDKALSGAFYRGLLHHLAENDTRFVQMTYSYIREYGKDAGWSGNVIAQINEALTGRTDTTRPHEAFEEVFADKVAEMFEDENFMRYVSRKNMTFLQRLWENIKSFIIRSLGGAYTPPADVIDAKTAEEIIGKMSDIQVLVADALDRMGRDRTKAAAQTAKGISKTANKLDGKYAELNGESYTESEWQEYETDEIEYREITVEELRSTLSKMPDAILRTLAREMEYEFESATATGRKIEFAKNVLSRLHPEDIVSIPSMAYRDGDISPLTSKAQKSNISALKKTGSVKTVRRYGYQNVADGVMVYVTDPSRIPLSNAHADNLAAGKSLAGALGFERLGYYTGEIRNINGKEIKTESRAIIGKDGTLYINLNADSPYTAIVGASWFENLRKTNTQTAAALVKAYDRYRKLTRSKADISQWIGKQLTGTQSTALFTGDKLFTEELANLMHMNASEILRVIEADPQFSSLIARGDMTLAKKTLDSIKRFFTRFGDTIARMTGNTDSRAASALTIAQKNLLIAMRNAPIDGARAIRTDEERAAEYRRIQRIEEEIERINRLEAERERAAQKERADRRRDYYEELDRQEAEKKRARESRRKWNWGDIPDGEGGDLNSFMSRHVDNENGELYNQSRGDNNERDTNTGILESGKVPTADRNKNGLWERDKNSRYLAGLLGVAEDGEITAGLSGFLEGYNRDEGLSSGRLRQNTIRDLSAKRIRSTDTVGRKISESLQRKLAKTAIKAEDGTILSLYHWTNAVFDKFEKGDVGFHFGTFGASHAIMYDKSKPREKGYFKEAFLNVENPIIIEHDPSRWDVLSTAGKLSQMGVITPDEFNALASCSGFIRSEYGDEAVTELHVLLMQKGYDGVIYTNDFEGGYSVIAFRPEQIIIVAENGRLKPESGLLPASKENSFMSRSGDSDSTSLGKGLDDLFADNAEAVEKAISRFEQPTGTDAKSQTHEIEPDPAPIINQDPDVRSEYQELRDRFGTIPQGEDINSRGDVGIPKRTQKNNKVRQGIRTFAEAKATPDEVVGELEREIVKGTFSYTPLSDKAANSYAKEMIEADPEEALREWDAVVRSTKPATKKQIALAENLIMEAAAMGDTDTAVRLIAEVAAEGTRAGQAVQAFRMIKKLSPMGQLYSLQRAIDKLNRENENRGTKIELPTERLEDYAKTVTELEDLQRRIAELEKKVKTSDEKGRLHDEIDSLRDEVEQKKKDAERQLDNLKDDVADQMPKSWTEKLNAWRYLSMLGNPRTHIRNILGNAVFAPTVTLKSKLAAVVEAGVKKVNPEFERSQALTASKAIKEFAARDATESLEQLANGGKYNAGDELRERQKVFSERNIVGRAVNKASEFNSALLEMEDAMFLRKRYTYALAHYCAANRWNVAHLNANPADLQRAREFAFREAQRATYRDMNAFSHFLSQASNKLRDGKGFSRLAYWAMEGAMPFKKTPANIIKRGIEYSPIGLLGSLSTDILRLKRGEINGAEYINNLAAGMTGTMVLGLGYLLASLDVLRGRNKDDEDEFEKLRGAQEWSLVIGDVSYTIDWLAPMSLPLFVGVELYDQTANSNDKMDMQDILDSLTAISEPIFSLSMMDGVQSLLQSYSSEGAISDMFMSALQSYAGQMTPTILGQLARTLDDTSRNAYYNDKTSWWSNTVMQPIRSAMAKIPGLEQQLPARVDAWGRTTEGTTSIGERFVQNFLSPGYWSVDKTTPVDEEIQKIYDETGDSSVLPDTAPKQFGYNGETYYLSSEEYVTFAVDRGQTAYAIIDELINNKTYKSLSAKDRAEAINKAYDIALDYAKGNTGSGFDAESNKAIKAFNESGVEYSDYILFSVLCTGASQADAYKALNKMRYLTDSERSAIWNTKGWKTSYADYKAEH